MAQPARAYQQDPLSTTFASWNEAHNALYREGFKMDLPHLNTPFSSRDGLISATIRYRHDGRYQIDMIA